MFRSSFVAVPDTGHVNVHEVLPGLLLYLVRVRTEREDARVRHDDVEPAELGHSIIYRLRECVYVAHICFCGDDSPVKGFDLSNGLCQVFRCCRLIKFADAVDLGAQVNGDDVGAPLASRSAWLRPCPRAAPVTNATFPSSVPMIRFLHFV
jgi:hypothetical protein